MLITVASVKAAMGLENPELEDAEVDPKVESAILMAQALVSGYIGMNVEVGGEAEVHTLSYPGPFRTLNLPKWPVSSDEPVVVAVDDTALAVDTDYSVQYKRGTVTFNRQYNNPKKVEITYSPGFDSYTAPADLKMALSNMAIFIYNLPPGGFGAASATGPLKSMTMFDAMSLSFETGEHGGINSPKDLVDQWAYILNQYSVKIYTMAGVS